MKQIRIKIMPDGRIEAETLGMQGKQCLKYLMEIERMANAVCTDSEFTPDYYKTDNELVSEADEEITA